ncbi:MAG: glycerophosphodiester phosphodiesterase [Bacteroidia bacterium]
MSCNRDQKIIETNEFIISENVAPLIIAHGGSKALFPENTMLAFDESVKIGVDALEMDVCLTKDEILVTHHDKTIDRMSDGEGAVYNYTFADLLNFNFGYDFVDLKGDKPYKNSKVEIAKLESVIEKYSNYPLIIEIKDEDELGKKAADLLTALIDKYGIKSTTIIASFHDNIIDYIIDKDNGFLVSTAESEARRMVITTKSGMTLFYKPSAMALQLPMESAGLNLTRKRIIKHAHKRNMAVHYWTINNKEDMKLLIENGADGLITDRPDLMNEVLIEMGF